MSRRTDAEVKAMSQRNKAAWAEAPKSRPVVWGDPVPVKVSGRILAKPQKPLLFSKAANPRNFNVDADSGVLDIPKNPSKQRQAVRGGAGRAELSLPFPPSVNHYWERNRNGSMRVGEKGKAYQSAATVACRGLDGVMGRVAVQVIAYPPDRRKRDLDNVFKALLDALNHTGMIEDDSMIDDLHIIRRERVSGGRVDVVVTAL